MTVMLKLHSMAELMLQVKDPLAQMRERLEAQRTAAPKYQAGRTCHNGFLASAVLHRGRY